MMTGSLLIGINIPLNKTKLAEVRAKTVRQGIWFRVLTRAERAIVELSMKIVKRIRSRFLAKVMTGILKKLLDAMESKTRRLMRTVGPTLAQKLSRIAQKWGNESAHEWVADPSFIQYLTINYINTPEYLQV
jgi:hypothetical protein